MTYDPQMNVEERIAQVFAATEAELRAHYGELRPQHYGALISWRDGGPDPLSGVSVYEHPDGHWHYVGFGMSERAEKETPNLEVSGWGFELTFRLKAHGATHPTWPIVLLNDFARYVFDSRRPLRHADFVERPNDPRSRYWGIVADPILRPVSTVNGRFGWMQIVALSEPEFRRLGSDDYAAFLEELAKARPLYVSDITPPA